MFLSLAVAAIMVGEHQKVDMIPDKFLKEGPSKDHITKCLVPSVSMVLKGKMKLRKVYGRHSPNGGNISSFFSGQLN